MLSKLLAKKSLPELDGEAPIITPTLNTSDFEEEFAHNKKKLLKWIDENVGYMEAGDEYPVAEKLELLQVVHPLAHVVCATSFMEESSGSYPLPWLVREIVQNFVDGNTYDHGTLNGVNVNEKLENGRINIRITGNWKFKEPTGLKILFSDKKTKDQPDTENKQPNAGGNGIGLKQTALCFLRDYGVEKFIIHGEKWSIEYKIAKAEDVNRELKKMGFKHQKIEEDWLIAEKFSSTNRKRCQYEIVTKNKDLLHAFRKIWDIGECDKNSFLENPDYNSKQGSITWLLHGKNGDVPKGRLFICGQPMHYRRKGNTDENYWQGPEYATLCLRHIEYDKSVDRPPINENQLQRYASKLIQKMSKSDLVEQLKKSEPLWTKIKDTYETEGFGGVIILKMIIDKLAEKGFTEKDFKKTFTEKKYIAEDKSIDESIYKKLEKDGCTICPSYLQKIGMPNAKTRIQNMSRKELITEIKDNEDLWSGKPDLSDTYTKGSMLLIKIMVECLASQGFDKKDFQRYFSDKSYIAEESSYDESIYRKLKEEGHTICPSYFQKIGMLNPMEYVKNMSKSKVIEELQKTVGLWDESQNGGKRNVEGSFMLIRMMVEHLAGLGFTDSEFTQSFSKGQYLTTDPELYSKHYNKLRDEGFIICPEFFQKIGMKSAKTKIEMFDLIEKNKPQVEEDELIKTARRSFIFPDIPKIEKIRGIDEYFYLIRAVSEHFTQVNIEYNGRESFLIDIKLPIPEAVAAKPLYRRDTEVEQMLYAIRGLLSFGLTQEILTDAAYAQSSYFMTFSIDKYIHRLLSKNVEKSITPGLSIKVSSDFIDIAKSILNAKRIKVEANNKERLTEAVEDLVTIQNNFFQKRTLARKGIVEERKDEQVVVTRKQPITLPEKERAEEEEILDQDLEWWNIAGHVSNLRSKFKGTAPLSEDEQERQRIEAEKQAAIAKEAKRRQKAKAEAVRKHEAFKAKKDEVIQVLFKNNKCINKNKKIAEFVASKLNLNGEVYEIKWVQKCLLAKMGKSIKLVDKENQTIFVDSEILINTLHCIFEAQNLLKIQEATVKHAEIPEKVKEVMSVEQRMENATIWFNTCLQETTQTYTEKEKTIQETAVESAQAMKDEKKQELREEHRKAEETYQTKIEEISKKQDRLALQELAEEQVEACIDHIEKVQKGSKIVDAISGTCNFMVQGVLGIFMAFKSIGLAIPMTIASAYEGILEKLKESFQEFSESYLSSIKDIKVQREYIYALGELFKGYMVERFANKIPSASEIKHIVRVIQILKKFKKQKQVIVEHHKHNKLIYDFCSTFVDKFPPRKIYEGEIQKEKRIAYVLNRYGDLTKYFQHVHDLSECENFPEFVLEKLENQERIIKVASVTMQEIETITKKAKAKAKRQGKEYIIDKCINPEEMFMLKFYLLMLYGPDRYEEEYDKMVDASFEIGTLFEE